MAHSFGTALLLNVLQGTELVIRHGKQMLQCEEASHLQGTVPMGQLGECAVHGVMRGAFLRKGRVQRRTGDG